jgi:hypothetical protein
LPAFSIAKKQPTKKLLRHHKVARSCIQTKFWYPSKKELTQGDTRSVSRLFYLAVSLRFALGPLPSAPYQLLPTVLAAFDRAHIDQPLQLHLNAIFRGFGVGRDHWESSTPAVRARSAVLIA